MANELQLDAEEQELLDSHERGEWSSIAALQDNLRRYEGYAATVLETAGFISIVLPTQDLKMIQRKAAEAGMPYQSFIASVLHEFVSGQLVEKGRT
jgi:predicted DNA binding CopG/RHH family protein